MSCVIEWPRGRVPHFLALALISVSAAACSGDVNRFSDSLSNPFALNPGPMREATGTVPRSAAPVTRVESAPLAAAPIASAPQALTPAYAPSTPSYSVATKTPRIANHVAAPTASAAPGFGGTTIFIGSTDTMDGIARRYNVTPSAIMAANGMHSPRLQPGQQLVIPRATAANALPPAAPAPVAPPPVKPVAEAPQRKGFHTVARGDTMSSVARKYSVPVAQLAKANNAGALKKLTPGEQLRIPTAAAAAPVQTQPAVAEVKPVEAPAPEPVKVASVQPAVPAQAARLASATDKVEEPSVTKAAETTGAVPSFRWPARGRVIAPFGAKTNGQQNDGINLAVPEGTPIKAAEDGVVAYAGSELKGYGNLVLIRHSNGYVSAYAHASEIEVKRGDAIKRGQVIGKSGQTGNVQSPQLHFEIRKGASPMDPLQFLNGA